MPSTFPVMPDELAHDLAKMTYVNAHHVNYLPYATLSLILCAVGLVLAVAGWFFQDRGGQSSTRWYVCASAIVVGLVVALGGVGVPSVIGDGQVRQAQAAVTKHTDKMDRAFDRQRAAWREKAVNWYETQYGMSVPDGVQVDLVEGRDVAVSLGGKTAVVHAINIDAATPVLVTGEGKPLPLVSGTAR